MTSVPFLKRLSIRAKRSILISSRMVRLWFSYAARDLKMAFGALQYGNHFKNEAAFHSQQCVEKAMKGYLAFHRVRPPPTHDLVELARLIKKIDKGLLPLFRNA